MTEFSRLSQFGMMFKPLTEDFGEELLMSYLAAFRAKTSPQPEREQESMESGQECGEKWQGSFTKYDPDSSSWRTHQCSLLGGLELFSETWPRWGLMRDGECWERQMSELPTSETESGFWPTPTASMMPCEGTVRIMRRAWQDGRVSLEEASVIAGRDVRKAQGKVPKWPTPDANMGNRGTQENWTPTRKSGQPAQYPINQALRDAEKKSGRPNPVWIEWLMGWPLGWTDLKPLETDKFQKWLDEHGS